MRTRTGGAGHELPCAGALHHGAGETRTSKDDSEVAALGNLITATLDEARGEEIVYIDLVGKTTIADGMIIASGRSSRHVASLAEKLIDRLKKSGRRNVKVEGLELGEWVLLDVGDIIVHIFQPEIRDFYNLEKMWSSIHPRAAAGQGS